MVQKGPLWDVQQRVDEGLRAHWRLRGKRPWQCSLDGEGEVFEVVEGGGRVVGETEVGGALDGPKSDLAASIERTVEPGAVAALTLEEGVATFGGEGGGGEFQAADGTVAHADAAGEDTFGLVDGADEAEEVWVTEAFGLGTAGAAEGEEGIFHVAHGAAEAAAEQNEGAAGTETADIVADAVLHGVERAGAAVGTGGVKREFGEESAEGMEARDAGTVGGFEEEDEGGGVGGECVGPAAEGGRGGLGVGPTFVDGEGGDDDVVGAFGGVAAEVGADGFGLGEEFFDGGEGGLGPVDAGGVDGAEEVLGGEGGGGESTPEVEHAEGALGEIGEAGEDAGERGGDAGVGLRREGEGVGGEGPRLRARRCRGAWAQRVS